MKYGEWLNEVEPKPTPKGARLDLRIYVYPDGHGNILLKSDGNGGQPVGNVDEAASVLKDLWEKASRAHEETARNGAASELDSLLAQIPEDYEPDEIDFGGPVGREIW